MGLGLGAGVRVPVSFVVKKDSYATTLVVAGSLVVILVVVLLWTRRSGT